MEKSRIEVLLIEDNIAEADRIKEMLAKARKQEFVIEHVMYLADGISQLDRRNFDIILVDLGLPDSQGLDTPVAVRNRTKRIPIVVLTVLNDEDVALKSLEIDIQDYLVKEEINSALLSRAIRYAIHRKKVAEELEQLNARQRKLVAMLEFSRVMACDLEDRIIHWPHAMQELYGWTKEEALGIQACVLFRTVFPQSREEIFATLFRKDVWEGELVHHRKDGTPLVIATFWFLYRNSQGEPTAIIKTSNDITERKRNEQALRIVQEQLQLITDLMAAGVSYCSRERRYLWTSPAYAEWLGRRPEEIAGESVAEVLGRETYEAIAPYIDRVLMGQKVSYETRIQYADGKARWVRAEYTPTHDTEGMPDGWIAVVTDLTAMKELEQELQQAKDHLEKRVAERTAELESTVVRLEAEIAERMKAEQALKEETGQRLRALQELREKEQLLIQQSRMAAMGEMIGFIAHQWRQPLNNLGLIVQELARSYKRGAFTQEYLDDSTARAMQLIMQMSQTIDDFRNFFRVEKEKVPFRLNDVLAKTIKLVEASFREIDLHIDVLGEDAVDAQGYPNEYSQVLLNILLNARDVCLERHVEQSRVFIRVFRDNDRAVMTIADNAGGISEENIGRIFDPYFTTKGPDRGTGVGLYMAKTIIEKNMNGLLSVRNTAEGAEFRIEV